MKKQLKQLEEFHRAFGLYINEQPTLRIPQDLHELRMRVMKEESYRMQNGRGLFADEPGDSENNTGYQESIGI